MGVRLGEEMCEDQKFRNLTCHPEILVHLVWKSVPWGGGHRSEKQPLNSAATWS